MPRKTKADFQEECRDLRYKLSDAMEEYKKLEGKLSDLKLEMANLEARQGHARGAAEAWESAYRMLVRHYQLVNGSPEAIAAIADEERRLNERHGKPYDPFDDGYRRQHP